MTLAVWPTDLPKPERASWQASPMEARLKRQGDSGPASYRRRFSSVAKATSLSIVVSRDGKAIFDNFYAEETARGSLPFYMPDPTTDGWPLLIQDGSPLLTHDGTPVLLSAEWLCLFGDAVPVEAVVGVAFRISFSVMVMP